MQKEKTITLGSLFDGIGAVPLAASYFGIAPIWASEILPNAVAVTKRHFPNMEHLGDITKIDGGKIQPVDIVAFGSPCFPAGTLILTERGYMPIENVSIGDRVLTHKGKWRNVTAAGSKISDTIVLKGGHYSLETTPEHPIYNLSGKTYGWVHAKDMAGKQWSTPKYAEPLYPVTPSPIRNSVFPNIDKPFLHFLGLWLGIGKADVKQNTLMICLNRESKYTENAIAVMKCLGKKLSSQKTGKTIEIHIRDKMLCEWTAMNFGNGNSKRIPAWVYGLPRDQLQAFYDGCMGFGQSANGHKTFHTRSKALAFGLRTAAEILGDSTAIHRNSTALKSAADCSGSHYFLRTQRNTGFIYDEEHAADKSRLQSWHKCKSVVPTSKRKIVYNLSVETDESYVADGIVVHNCQSFSIAGKGEGLDGKSGLFMEAIRVIREMKETTGNEYPKLVLFENVLGLLSNKKGNDFRIVLEAFTESSVPMPASGRWAKAGMVRGKGIDLAWVVKDAQHYRVAQRRRRLFVVVDFAEMRASEILFKPTSLSGYFEARRRESKKAREQEERKAPASS